MGPQPCKRRRLGTQAEEMAAPLLQELHFACALLDQFAPCVMLWWRRGGWCPAAVPLLGGVSKSKNMVALWY